MPMRLGARDGRDLMMRRRPSDVGWLLWVCAAALAAVWFSTWWQGCRVSSLYLLALIGSGLFAAGATFATFVGRRGVAAVSIAVLVALVVGVAVSAVLLALGLFHWVGSCTA
jgi:hypothetical protein